MITRAGGPVLAARLTPASGSTSASVSVVSPFAVGPALPGNDDWLWWMIAFRRSPAALTCVSCRAQHVRANIPGWRCWATACKVHETLRADAGKASRPGASFKSALSCSDAHAEKALRWSNLFGISGRFVVRHVIIESSLTVSPLALLLTLWTAPALG